MPKFLVQCHVKQVRLGIFARRPTTALLRDLIKVGFDTQTPDPESISGQFEFSDLSAAQRHFTEVFKQIASAHDDFSYLITSGDGLKLSGSHVTCRPCSGTGTVWVNCSSCGGSGRYTTTTQHDNYVSCSNCGGSGRHCRTSDDGYAGTPCWNCNGTGRRNEPTTEYHDQGPCGSCSGSRGSNQTCGRCGGDGEDDISDMLRRNRLYFLGALVVAAVILYFWQGGRP